MTTLIYVSSKASLLIPYFSHRLRVLDLQLIQLLKFYIPSYHRREVVRELSKDAASSPTIQHTICPTTYCSRALSPNEAAIRYDTIRCLYIEATNARLELLGTGPSTPVRQLAGKAYFDVISATQVRKRWRLVPACRELTNIVYGNVCAVLTIA